MGSLQCPEGFQTHLLSALTTSPGQGNFSFPALKLLVTAGSNALFVGIREGGGQLCSQGKGGETRAFLEDQRNLSPGVCAA